MPRVEFDLTRKPYGHWQAPAVIPSMTKAETMSDEEFEKRYEAIKAELGEQWAPVGSVAWEKDKAVREAACA
jgi:hypothetical protein